VTNPKIPRPTPAHRESLASDWDGLVSSARTTRLIAIGAIVVALVGLGLVAWRSLAPGDAGTGIATGAGGDCQAQAWAVTPATKDLPTDWTELGSQFEPMRKTIGFLGPESADGSTDQGQMFATITCFQTGAADSVARSQKAAADASQDPISRDDLGDQGFDATDASGNAYLQFRRGALVASFVAYVPASVTELDQLASAFDKAMGGDGGDLRQATPAPSDDLGNASLDPGDSGAPASPAAPELEAKLPTTVGDVPLTIDSQTGSTLIGEDSSNRAMLGVLRAAGKEADDLRAASASDDAGVLTIRGLPVEQTKSFVLGQWLSASGITQVPVTLAGKPFVKLDYGDEGPIDYVATIGTNVFVISTSDPAVAEQAAAALP
jgi:hypothetical protein